MALRVCLQVTQFLQHGELPGFGGVFLGPVVGSWALTSVSLRLLGHLYATRAFLLLDSLDVFPNSMGQWYWITLVICGRVG